MKAMAPLSRYKVLMVLTIIGAATLIGVTDLPVWTAAPAGAAMYGVGHLLLRASGRGLPILDALAGRERPGPDHRA